MPDALKSVYDLANQRVYQINIPLSRWKEDEPFTHNENYYDSLADFKEALEEDAFRLGLSLLDVERINDTHVAIKYSNPVDHQELLFAAGGDLPKLKCARLFSVQDSNKPYIDAYMRAIEMYCRERNINVICEKNENAAFKITVTGLTNMLHIVAVHRKGQVLGDAIDLQKAHIMRRFAGKQNLLPPPDPSQG